MNNVNFLIEYSILSTINSTIYAKANIKQSDNQVFYNQTKDDHENNIAHNFSFLIQW